MRQSGPLLQGRRKKPPRLVVNSAAERIAGMLVGEGRDSVHDFHHAVILYLAVDVECKRK
jgi:ribosomal protein S18 acetylase RimI-like enzyme